MTSPPSQKSSNSGRFAYRKGHRENSYLHQCLKRKYQTLPHCLHRSLNIFVWTNTSVTDAVDALCTGPYLCRYGTYGYDLAVDWASVSLRTGLGDLRGLFQPEEFYESITIFGFLFIMLSQILWCIIISASLCCR